jgi:hypothetical protein
MTTRNTPLALEAIPPQGTPTVSGLPEPTCAIGYTEADVATILGPERLKHFERFMQARTYSACDGCTAGGPHGGIVPTTDVFRFVRGLQEP